ncbi:hypothetical protein CC78DRAFT_612889 [Lojkania enalia]|uniref:Uncharacterized protein n=1 Tax=Lojkania enalia TaxID=147567 RepID=A0A9P4TPD5_9PLEO|nr:hypothetical protein CC78DRAFT_612889 [Didymosphaeria enalia]
MTNILESARDYAQSRPISVAAGLIIALPGAYMLLSANPIPCSTPGIEVIAKTAGLCSDSPSPLHSPIAGSMSGLTVYDRTYPLDPRLLLPVSKWSDKPTRTFLLHTLQEARKNVSSLVKSTSRRLGLDVDVHEVARMFEGRWASRFPFYRYAAVAVTTALPGAFLIFVKSHPNSWAARHQTRVSNTLHMLALLTVANQGVSVQDLLVTTLVMASFEVLRLVTPSTTHLGQGSTSAFETPSSTRSAAPGVDADEPSRHGHLEDDKCVAKRGASATDLRDEEIGRLRDDLVDMKASARHREDELKRAQADLRNAQEILDETFTECSTLRDEMKTMKTAVGRDQQAAIYRKDIELFALRKSIEQKESHIKDQEARLDYMNRQHKAAMELKEVQVRHLTERLGSFEKHEAHDSSGSTPNPEHQTALQVKLLRVNGRSSFEGEQPLQEKDLEIARLKSDLIAAQNAPEALSQAQRELSRAWDATYEMQNALNDERHQRRQIESKLRDAATMIEEMKRLNQKNSPTRLPTIEEQDQKELESMFNTAQQDNLRLHSELDASSRHLREANARLLANKKELDIFKEQLRLEKAINQDMEAARPSVVHRAHYQRMEGQLKESTDELAAKEEMIRCLQEDVAAKQQEFENLKKSREAVECTKAELQEENGRLKRTVAQLESTKEKLMMDHERLAKHRARDRMSIPDHASARSSGATLITDHNINSSLNEDTPLPPRPVTMASQNRVAERPDTHHSPTTLINVPSPEQRSSTTRRRSLTLKGLMKKMVVRKDEDEEAEKWVSREAASQRPKTALSSRDKNTVMRPTVEADKMEKKEKLKPKSAGPNKRMSEIARPRTAAGQKENSGVGPSRPKSRGWSSGSKLVRKSVG